MEKLLGMITFLINKIICPDIEKQKQRYMEEFHSLIGESENFKHRLNEFQTERMIENTFSSEKTNRQIVLMTFAILVLTIVMTFKK